MLDLITISYKLTINVSNYLQEYIQYPVDYTYITLTKPQVANEQNKNKNKNFKRNVGIDT